jgi:hypothetical protein
VCSTRFGSGHERRGRFWALLLQAAESEALRRGCTCALLDSYSFQAPDFYKKLGYQEFGLLEDFPAGHRLHFLWKQLG